MLKRFGVKLNPNDSSPKQFESLGWRKLLHARSNEDRYSRSQVDLGSITDTYGINGHFLSPTLVLNQGQQTLCSDHILPTYRKLCLMIADWKLSPVSFSWYTPGERSREGTIIDVVPFSM